MPDDKSEDIIALVKRCGSVTEAARQSGIPRTTLNERYQRALNPIKIEEPNKRREKLALEDRIRVLEKALRAKDSEELTADKITSYFLNLRDRPLTEPDWVLKRDSSKGDAGVPITNWSDWHFGEIVDPPQVDGANAFNIAIFNKRFATLIERTIDICRNHMTGNNFPGIVVNLGGDMLSGNIHEELHQTNEMESIPSILELAGKISWGLRQFADCFGRVFVPCTPGNHGRNTKKPQSKNVCHTSFDWMIYKIVESHFQKDDRITFLVPNSFDTHYRVFSHRILLTHGDRIGSKGGDGFIGVIGPILRGAHKVRLAYAARDREIDTILMGHWHNEVTLPGLRVNNCLKGADEWSMAMRFPPTPPSQDLFFLHPKRGITSSWPVQLETSKHGSTNTPWSSWRSE